MHNIRKITYDETVNKRSVQQEWDEVAATSGKREGVSGLSKGIKWHDHVCDTYEDAEAFIAAHDSGWYDQLAVKYLSYPELSSKKIEDLRIRLQKANNRLQELNTFHFAGMKSQFIGCKKCGSKLSLSYMKSNHCPLCGADLRPETKLAAIKNAKSKIKELSAAIDAEEKGLQKKMQKKASVRWLVKVEYHS